MATCTLNKVGYCVDLNCAGHRTGCSTNLSLSWWDGDLDRETITASTIEDLRVKIRTLVSQFNANPNYSITSREPDQYTRSTVVQASHLNNLDLMVGNIGGTYGPDVSTGTVINDVEWDALLTRFNTVRQMCVCNSDCRCNAVCSCNSDCICNYSDRRLKDDIEYC